MQHYLFPRALLLSDQMMRELQEAVEEGGPAVRLKDLLLVWFAGAPLLDTFLLTHIDCIGFSILS